MDEDDITGRFTGYLFYPKVCFYRNVPWFQCQAAVVITLQGSSQERYAFTY